MDAAHFVFAPFLGRVWSVTRFFVNAPAGRQRLNVLAAVNAITHELFTVENLIYMTAETVCELLRLLPGAYQGPPDDDQFGQCTLSAMYSRASCRRSIGH